MYLNQIPENSNLKLSVRVKNKSLVFNTRIIKAYKKPFHGNIYCIGCAPILHKGKRLSFGKYPVTVIVHDGKSGRDLQFITSLQGYNKKKTQYLLFSKDSAKPVNNRESLRVPCSFKVVVQIGNNNQPIDGYTHDISYSGISLLFLSELFQDSPVGETVSASIFDHQEHVYKVIGEIVRMEGEFDNDKTLIGIKFTKPSNMINALVTNLQRQELRIKH